MTTIQTNQLKNEFFLKQHTETREVIFKNNTTLHEEVIDSVIELLESFRTKVASEEIIRTIDPLLPLYTYSFNLSEKSKSILKEYCKSVEQTALCDFFKTCTWVEINKKDNTIGIFKQKEETWKLQPLSQTRLSKHLH